MIHYIPHNQIDIQKYNACVQNSLHTLLYVESWFLNIEAKDNWDILMANDYAYVMPITYFRLKRSFWKKSLIQPYHCQQLGILSPQELSAEMHYAFMHKLWELNPTGYNFNHGQNVYLNKQNLIKKNNYILPLNRSYNEIFQGFSKTRKRWIRKARKNDLQVFISSDIQGFIQFQKKHLGLNESSSVIAKRNKILSTALQKKIGRLYYVEYHRTCVAMAFFIQHKERLYYMQSAASQEGKQLHAMDLIMDYVIGKCANQPLIIDFEGSQIKGVADYMLSFGAVNEPFYVYRK